jgi:hypothetical protein
VRKPIDAATEAFLRSARSDLQRQLATSARLDALTADVNETGLALRAEVTVAHERLILTGTGESLVEAYAALIREAPPSVLASAYRQVLEHRLR